MDLTKIVSISGKSGLFKVVSQGKNVVIVESLADQKRFPAFGHEKMSSLEEISVFTTGEDRPLKEVFKTFYEKLEGKAAMDPKSETGVLLKFFGEMVPDFDHEKVYLSDIRKMISWYNLLTEQKLLDFNEAGEDKPAEQAEQEAPQASEPEEIPVAGEETKKPAVKTGKNNQPEKREKEPAPEPTNLTEETKGKAKPPRKAPRTKKQE